VLRTSLRIDRRRGSRQLLWGLELFNQDRFPVGGSAHCVALTVLPISAIAESASFCGAVIMVDSSGAIDRFEVSAKINGGAVANCPLALAGLPQPPFPTLGDTTRVARLRDSYVPR
jgi:hypothetical protein